MRDFLVLLLLLGELVAFSVAVDANSRNLRSSFQEGQKDRELQTIHVDEYTCATDTVAFNSTVLIDFHGDVSRLENEQIQVLEQEFQKAYNEIAFDLCYAPFFHTINDVSIELLSDTHNSNSNVQDEETHRYDETGVLKKTNIKHYLRVNIQAECRECNDITIFSGKGMTGIDSLYHLEPDSTTVVYKNINGEQVVESQEFSGQFLLESCVCPAGRTPAERTPTEAEFIIVFNRTIRSLETDVVEEKFGLYEVEEFECSSDASSVFTSMVYVRVKGDVSKLENKQIRALEEAFMYTYNDLNFEFCDFPYFRTISDVTLDTSSLPSSEEKRRMLQSSVVFLDFNESILLVDPPQDVSVLKMTVVAECKENCSINTPLFSYGAEATSQPEFEIADALNGQSNDIQGDSGTCICPAHPEPLDRSPTVAEFQKAFNITMGQLHDHGWDEDIELQDVLEVVEVDCKFTEIEFTSTVYVNLDRPLEMLNGQEAKAIEESFRNSYNALTFATCDQYFRDLREVRLVPTMIRRRQLSSRNLQANGTLANETTFENMEVLDDLEVTTTDDNNETMSNGTKNRFPAAFSVRGKCRNCQVNDNGSFELFDDTFNENVRRTLAQTKTTSFLAGSSISPSFQNRMLNNHLLEVCACPSDVPPDGSMAPTDAAFIDIFNGNLAALEEAGSLASFGLVTDLVETPLLCDGGTFVSYLERYDLVFVGDVGAVEDDILSETFRLSYNNQRPDECDPLLAEVFVVRRDVPFGGSLQDVEDLTSIFFGVDSLQIEDGSIFSDQATFVRFAEIFNAVMEGLGFSARVVSAELLPQSEAPSTSPSTAPSRKPTRKPTRRPTKKPTGEPTKSPSAEPSKSPSEEPSAEPTISPLPSFQPTNNQVMCSSDVISLTDHVILDYSVSRIADIDIDLPFDLPDIWPLQEPATLIAAEEFISAYNRLQSKVFCDPFKRKITTVSCVSVKNQVLSGRLCCTVYFKCFGNCDEFIYPDSDPIGAFYDESGFGYPTDDSCVCSKDGPERAPSASEHFSKLNDMVPYEILSFDFVGFASKSCPSS